MNRGLSTSKSKCDRSETMRRVKSGDTSLELSLRSHLWKMGLRYRLKSKLPGKPDILFPGRRIAVFVDSCFWHGCGAHCRMPSSHRSYWDKKIEGNRNRDLEVNSLLSEMGWKVIRIWEHDLLSNPDKCAEQIFEIVRAER
jgi:DNA mismatch endonuclease (patch repair protein)